MPQQPYDKSSKYLVQQQARGILLLGGAKGVHSIRALQAELVQPRQLPDWVLEVFFEKRQQPDHVLVEVEAGEADGQGQDDGLPDGPKPGSVHGAPPGVKVSGGCNRHSQPGGCSCPSFPRWNLGRALWLNPSRFQRNHWLIPLCRAR
jgi:hypothetical protein